MTRGRSMRWFTGVALGTLLAGALAAYAWRSARIPGSNVARVGQLAVRPRTQRHDLPAGVTAIALAADPATGGYWMLRSDGGVIAAGAPWHGSLLGSVPHGRHVTAIAAAAGGGYRILLSDGAVRSFGTRSHGSAAGRLPAGVSAVGLAADPATGGYWILRSDGGIAAFHAPARGSLAGRVPGGSAAAAVAGAGRGYRILVSSGGPVPADLAGRIWDVIPTTRKVVALTFDIGPVDGVPKILAVLRRDHVRATFNVVGRVARKYPATVRSIAAAGELIGDHSNNHPRFTRISDRRVSTEVLQARTAIEAATGRDVQPWFRFPFGDSDARTLADVNAAGFVPVGWTVDSLGWKGTSGGVTVREVIERVVRARRPGEIVLMHGGADAPGDHSTLDADALASVISKLRAFGYSFVTMDALRGLGASQHAVNGSVHSFGGPDYGSDAGRLPAQVTAVGLASDPVTGGYWILLSTGAVDAFHAPHLGSLAGQVPAGSVVTGLAATSTGYLVLTSDGTVTAFAAKH